MTNDARRLQMAAASDASAGHSIQPRRADGSGGWRAPAWIVIWALWALALLADHAAVAAPPAAPGTSPAFDRIDGFQREADQLSPETVYQALLPLHTQVIAFRAAGELNAHPDVVFKLTGYESSLEQRADAQEVSAVRFFAKWKSMMCADLESFGQESRLRQIVNQCWQQVLQLLRASADAGDAPATGELARLTAQGKGGPASKSRAAQLWVRAGKRHLSLGQLSEARQAVQEAFVLVPGLPAAQQLQGRLR